MQSARYATTCLLHVYGRSEIGRYLNNEDTPPIQQLDTRFQSTRLASSQQVSNHLGVLYTGQAPIEPLEGVVQLLVLEAEQMQHRCVKIL